MEMYIVVIRNGSLAREVNNRKSSAGIQLTLFDFTKYGNQSDEN
jgi:hypothetical protein